MTISSVAISRQSLWKLMELLSIICWIYLLREAVVQRCSVKKVFIEISQNPQENTCARASFLLKLHFLISDCFCDTTRNKHPLKKLFLHHFEWVLLHEDRVRFIKMKAFTQQARSNNEPSVLTLDLLRYFENNKNFSSKSNPLLLPNFLYLPLGTISENLMNKFREKSISDDFWSENAPFTRFWVS